jgi:hypothetical protein
VCHQDSFIRLSTSPPQPPSAITLSYVTKLINIRF